MVLGNPSSTVTERLYATRLDEEVLPRVLESYRGMRGDEVPLTIFDLFTTCVQAHPQRNALAIKRPPEGVSPKDTDWTYITWQQYHDKTIAFAQSLLASGFAPHDAINILGFNSPEWFISYMAAMAVGGVAAGIYTTNQPASCHYVTKHSEAAFVVVDSVEQLKKYKDATAQDLPHLKFIILYSCALPEGLVMANPDIKLYEFETFLTLGAHVPKAQVLELAKQVKPGHCASLIYTSGTTGPPKAVMLSHDNVGWSVRQAQRNFPDLRPTDTMVSYLPLSHVAAQLMDAIMPLFCGGCLYFAQPDALKGSLIHTLLDVRPHFFFAVPRVWEKFYERLMEVRATMPKPVLLLGDFLKEQTKVNTLSKQYEQQLEEPWALKHGQAMSQKIKRKMGLDRVRYFASGAAPISTEVTNYFASLGIPIYEVYGLSESTALCSSNCPAAWKVGTVGRPYPGQEARIDPATGELHLRGRHVFMGYLKMEEDTRNAILPGGWLRTGDVVTIDTDHDLEVVKPSGFIKIVGRCKEILITAGGENIPPALIEDEIKAALPGLAACMVVGDRRKFLTVLLTLETDEEGNLSGHSKAVCDEIGATAATPQEAETDKAWVKYIEEGLKAANRRATSRAQHVQKWAFLPRDFSEANGELTPTLKLKRNVCAAKYADIIERMYESNHHS